MEPRRPNPKPPPARPAPDTSGDTASGPHTAPGLAALIPRELRRGEMIDSYRIVRELGRGGMAIVYEAQDTELPRRVALKVLLSAAADAQGKARFVREAHAQASINHDHVVTIFRVGEAAGVSYIAMPVLNGQTLAKALETTPRPPIEHAVRIGGEIAEGLAAAHAVGLIHRDIKPANVWLEEPKWRVKILDFGLARGPQANAGGEITVRGHVVGTPAYMSPEQAKGEAVDYRTDLWSLGVVLYQMTTGRKPFTGDYTLSLMTAIISEHPPAPAELAPDVPPALSDLILRLLSKDPAGRPASANEVVAELDAVARSLTASPVVVVWHPATAPDPWSEIGSTAADTTSRDREPGDEPEDDEYEDDRPSRRIAPARGSRSFTWAWIGGGTALAAVLLGGLIWLAVAAVSPKTKTTEAVEQKEKEPPKPAPAPKPPSAPDAERAAAAALIPKAKLKLLVDDQKEVEVPVGGALPAGRLAVLEIDYDDAKGLNPLYVSGTFLPAVSELRSLTQVRLLRWQMELSAAQVGQLAARPLANTLKRFDGQLELTPASLTELKKFKALGDLTVRVPAPSDALFASLADELPQLEFLTLYELPASAALTEKGWQALGKMPQLGILTVAGGEQVGVAFRTLTAKGMANRLGLPALEFQASTEITDETLRALRDRPTDLARLSFRAIEITDRGLEHLAGVKTLKRLTLNSTKVTEQGIRALVAARPDVRIVWDGRVFEPTK